MTATEGQTEQRMTASTRLVWQALRRLAGARRYYGGSYSQLAAVSRVSMATVRRAMDHFAARGLIEIERDERGWRKATRLLVGD